MRTSLSVSYMEIYKEDAYDLLVERESVSMIHQQTRITTEYCGRLPNCQFERTRLVKCLSQT